VTVGDRDIKFGR